MRYLMGLFVVAFGLGAAYFLIERLSLEEQAVLLGVIVGVALAGPLALLIALALRRAAPAPVRRETEEFVQQTPLVIQVSPPAPPEPARLWPADMYRPVQVQMLEAGDWSEVESAPAAPFRIVEW